jgi:hypothetical protein
MRPTVIGKFLLGETWPYATPITRARLQIVIRALHHKARRTPVIVTARQLLSPNSRGAGVWPSAVSVT